MRYSHELHHEHFPIYNFQFIILSQRIQREALRTLWMQSVSCWVVHSELNASERSVWRVWNGVEDDRDSSAGTILAYLGVEGVVRGLEGLHLADRCLLTKLE
jgi:hypothetical protein